MEKVLISELMESNNDLYHHGVLGMKWGVRRYQPYSLVPRKSGKGGKETGDAKSASKNQNSGLNSAISKLKSKKNKTDVAVSTIKKSRKQKQEEVKSQRISDEKTARERKLKAAEVVKSGDARLIYENRKNLTDKQLSDAIDRISTEKKLRSLVAEQNPSKLQKVVKTIDKVKPLIDTAETGINAYNQVARVANAFMGEKEDGNRTNPLPYIGKPQNNYRKSDGKTDAGLEILSSTSVSDLMKNSKKLNTTELADAAARAKALNALRNEYEIEQEAAKNKADKAQGDSEKKKKN